MALIRPRVTGATVSVPQRSPHPHLPCHLHQLFQGDTSCFQASREIWSGCLEGTQCLQMLEPPQHAPYNAEAQPVYSKPLPEPITQGEPKWSLWRKLVSLVFVISFFWSVSTAHVHTICEGWNIDQPVNWQLRLPAVLSGVLRSMKPTGPHHLQKAKMNPELTELETLQPLTAPRILSIKL